ncbi:MAG: sigma-70 family RNA polymerase sigma factor [Acidobacteria bacterium]|nr:sigma-70 family RNA polymerase sigma factor [Acidobacteriota bacterium]MCI0722543.1 sigma-70 family RNA polymerase sigma factor [Acidobacteriota bacterium]
MKLDEGGEVRALLDRLQGPLIRYAVQITGDLERARDVVQDTFLQLCSENLVSLNGHLEPWLFTVCRNRALDVRRKEDRMNPLSEANAEPDGHDPDPFASLEQVQRLASVLSILATLPENQQEVIRLKFQNELSYKEISHITGLSVTNVGFLIHAGLKKIRQSMLAQPRENPKVLRRIK